MKQQLYEDYVIITNLFGPSIECICCSICGSTIYFILNKVSDVIMMLSVHSLCGSLAASCDD